MILIILSCSLLTIILIYLTTLHIDILEFILILVCFFGIIWILCTDKNNTERFEDGWNDIDAEKFKKMSNLPNHIKDMITKPIQQMTNSVTGADGFADLEPISEMYYIIEKDEYVGSEKEVKKKKKFVIDKQLFTKMKLEYQKIDYLLVMLKKGNKQLHKQIVPEPIKANDEKKEQEMEKEFEKEGEEE